MPLYGAALALLAAGCAPPTAEREVSEQATLTELEPAGQPLAACDRHYARGFLLAAAERRNMRAQPTHKPIKGLAMAGSGYGTCLVRVTDHTAEPPAGWARSYYSRRQAFNADNSRLLTHAENGYWHVYEANTLSHARRLSGLGGDSEPVWHPKDPDLLYFVDGARLMEKRVSTDQAYPVADFSDRLPWPDIAKIWTRWEGAPSRDARYWAFLAEAADGRARGLFTWDRKHDRILGTLPVETTGDKPDPDHLSMSPSGKYVVVSWLDGVIAYTLDFQQQKTLHGKSEHSDLAVGPNGNDVYVSIDYDSGHVYMTDLVTGQRTNLFQTYVNGTHTAVHFSGRAFDRPGWVLVSTYANGGGDEQWLHNKIFAVELKANPQILPIAHHRSRYTDYWSEPHATVNRDFTRILFNSNWGRSGKDVDAYMVVLPPDAIPGGSAPGLRRAAAR